MNREPTNEQKDFAAKLGEMDEAGLRSACNQYIWLSSYANNNPRSDYHWQLDYVYTECSKRGKVDIYKKEHEQLVKQSRGE